MTFDESYIEKYKNENTRFSNILNRLKWTHEVEKILDFGCGRGTLSRELTKIFPTVSYYGFDSSSEFIETAKNLNPKHFFTDDFTKLPIGNFDTVFALDVFNVIDKKFIPNTLNQIRLKMKINGKLIIHQPRSRQILSSLWKVRFKKYPGGLIEEHDLIQLLEQCGFSCNSLQRYTTLFPFLRYREIFLVEKVLPNFFLTRFIITAYAV
jgi:SAM-dependent methyltransferase